ncbi:MAG TPA: ATP-binding protein [Planctomycetota bacterium]|jgi:PAS domain S-box-containing protein
MNEETSHYPKTEPTDALHAGRDVLARSLAKLEEELWDGECSRGNASEVVGEYFRRLADALPAVVWIAAADGAIEYANKNWFDYTGYTLPQTSVPLGWLAAVHPEDKQRVLQAWTAGIQSGQHQTTEVRLRRADGEYRWHAARGAPLYDAGGNVLRWVGICMDVDDARRAQECLLHQNQAAQEASQAKDVFLAKLGHELRNALAPIRNAAEVIHAGSDDPRLRDMEVAVIQRQVKHVVALINDLLDVSRIRFRKLDIDPQQIDLVAIARRALESCQALRTSNCQRFTLDLPAQPVVILADATRIEQVLNNLLSNASKFTHPGGDIHVGLKVKEEEAVLTVRDNGSGISADMLPRVFDMFTQVSHGAEREPGLGLGLTLVRELVQMHGGSVHAESEGLGKGSQFTVRLPLAGSSSRLLPPRKETEAVDTGSPSMLLRVLIVEDEDDNRETLRQVFSMWGHQVEAAANGPEAIVRARTLLPDLALIDLGLPHMDGCEVARQMRTILGTDAFLVALTGFGQSSDRQRTCAAGFDQHLVKPADLPELQRVARAAAACAERKRSKTTH